MAERRKQFKLEPDQTEPVTPHLREVGGAEHLPNVSLTLRMARQRAGFELKDVAEVLRIRASNLEAIEAGRFDDLPGPTYVTGFLRSYAEFLGLDRDEIVARYREEIGAASRQKLSFPTPSQEGRLPRAWLILVALALVGLAYGGWSYYSRQSDGPAMSVAEPPADASPTPDTATTATTAAPSAPASGTATAASGGTDKTTPAIGSGMSLFQNDGDAAPSASEGTGAPSASAKDASPAKSESKPAAGASRSLWNDSSAPAGTAAPVAEDVTAEPARAISATPEIGAVAPEDDADETAPEPSRVAQAETAPTPMASAAVPARLSGEITANTLPPPTEAEIAALEQDGGRKVTIEAPSATAPVAVNGTSRVVIGAHADSWLQIQGPGNELVMTRILRPGETYAVPDRPGLSMVTGNAGGIEILVDGQAIAPLGPVGVVKRNVALDPDSLRATFGIANR